MASLLSSSLLKSGPTLGSASASSLIKSASTLQTQINTYNDTIAKITYENSAKTDGDLQVYLSYLSDRIGTLNSTGTIVAATKAADLNQTMVTAVHSNMSSNIQRENIQIMAGNATPTDKLNMITSQYQTAINIGDNSLAQTLESQAYSLSQTIQTQAQASADAAATLTKANASAEGNIATHLDSSLKELNVTLQHTGQKDFNSTISAWVGKNADAIKTLGVVLPKGTQPNYFDIVNGVMGAMYNHDMIAAQYLAPLDPASAQTYTDKATNLLNGVTTISTLGGSMTAQQVQQAASNPSQFAYDETSGSFKKTTQTGFSYDANGQIQGTYSGSVKQTVFLTPQQTTTMTKLGLNFTENTSGKNAGTTGNGVQVQATGKSPGWLKQILGGNGVSNMYSTSKGLVFEADSSAGQGKSYYTLGTDSKGLVGLYENLANGQVQAIGGDYGFNQNDNSFVGNKPNTGTAGGNLGTSNVSDILNQARQNAKVSYNQAQASKPVSTPVPGISPIPLAPPITTPNITPTVAQPTLQSVAPNTVNPQTQNTPKLQAPSTGFGLQGGGSGGIRLQ